VRSLPGLVQFPHNHKEGDLDSFRYPVGQRIAADIML
jgi:hypothetical protein